MYAWKCGNVTAKDEYSSHLLPLEEEKEEREEKVNWKLK